MMLLTAKRFNDTPPLPPPPLSSAEKKKERGGKGKRDEKESFERRVRVFFGTFPSLNGWQVSVLRLMRKREMFVRRETSAKLYRPCTYTYMRV